MDNKANFISNLNSNNDSLVAINDRIYPRDNIHLPNEISNNSEVNTRFVWRSLIQRDEDLNNANAFLMCLEGLTIQLEKNCLIKGRLRIRSPNVDSISSSRELIPSWEKFAKALRRYDKEIKLFAVDCVELPKEVLDVLTPALTNKRLTEVTLVDNNLDRDGILFMAEILERIPSLKSFVSNGNRIVDLAVATMLSNAISNHPSLQNLVLLASGLGCDIEVLSTITNAVKHIKRVNLYQNQIGFEGAVIISNMLAANPKMEELILRGNCIDDEAASSIAQALKSNECLQYFDLSENEQMTPKGQQSLRRSIFHDVSLNAIADSNHTCRLFLDETSVTDRTLALNATGRDANQAKRKKIFLALHNAQSGRMSIPFLDDVPLKLMPLVLEFLQRDPGEGRRWTNIFGVLIGWKMPLLFISGVGTGIGT